ncbi:type IV pilin protein [Alteromonas lipotrueiana]|uniref:type IV pilin protein n=1 Tax=Alteromonas lipotrueiana TaxID=2803815 RepID=UPI001C497409|nr:prepilin-type N-terminal cleavage/methylation domain-containing protein [Alteromonas lipotrueiana]
MGNSNGFTLVELMIALVISAILAAVAMPGYRHIIEQSQLQQARVKLLTLHSSQELYYLKHDSYANAAQLRISGSEFFSFDVVVADNNHYQLIARSTTPRSKCKEISLNQALEKKPAACW